MGVNKGIDSYYTRMNTLLRRWNNHNLPEMYLISTFVGGVWLETLRIYLREQNPPDLDYIVFKITESISPYPILLGRPWLFNGWVKEDWEKDTITVGKGKQKIV